MKTKTPHGVSVILATSQLEINDLKRYNSLCMTETKPINPKSVSSSPADVHNNWFTKTRNVAMVRSLAASTLATFISGVEGGKVVAIQQEIETLKSIVGNMGTTVPSEVISKLTHQSDVHTSVALVFAVATGLCLRGTLKLIKGKPRQNEQI